MCEHCETILEIARDPSAIVVYPASSEYGDVNKPRLPYATLEFSYVGQRDRHSKTVMALRFGQAVQQMCGRSDPSKKEWVPGA